MNQILKYALSAGTENNFSENTYNIIFATVYYNGTGLYRAILPMHEFNTHSKKIRINTCALYNFSHKNSLKTKDFSIPNEWIKQANLIVFQTPLSELDYAIESIKNINGDIKFAIDMDDNLHEYNSSHPNYSKITENDKNTLVKNLKTVDSIFVSTSALKQYYSKFTGDNKIKILPNFMSQICYEGIKINRPNGKIRIGLTLNPSQAEDLLLVKKYLRETKQHFGKNIEIHLFGWNGIFNEKKILNDIPYIYTPPVPVHQYFETMNKLRLSMALMPLQNNEFNRAKSTHKYLQYSMLQIPVLASNVPTYDIIKNNENGFSINNNDSWSEKIIKIIENNLHEPIAKTAKMQAENNYTWDKNKILRYENYFI